MRVWLRVAGAYRRNRYVSGDNLETECSVAVRARRENHEPARSSDRRRDERDGKGLLYSSSSLGCNCVPCVCPVGDLDKTTHAPRRDELESLRRHSLGAPTAAIDPPHGRALGRRSTLFTHQSRYLHSHARASRRATRKSPCRFIACSLLHTHFLAAFCSTLRCCGGGLALLLPPPNNPGLLGRLLLLIIWRWPYDETARRPISACCSAERVMSPLSSDRTSWIIACVR